MGTCFQPHSALLRAGFACCLGGTRAPGGDASCLGVGRPGSGALPPPTARPLGRAAGAHYPLAVGAGSAGVGTRHLPHCARSCKLALRSVGAARGRPGAGASCLGVGCPGSCALPPPTARPLGHAARAHYPLAVGAESARMGTHHQPHSARSWELALRAVGAARGRQGGAPLAWVWGVRGRALFHPRPLVLWGVLPGPTTHWLGMQGVRAWGRVTNPTARALASWLCALGRWHEGARGGRLLPGCGASGVGSSTTPDRSSFGASCRGLQPAGSGYGGCGRGDPSPTPPRALLRAGFARCGGGTRAPGGGYLLPGRGASRVGAHHPPAVSAGGAGVGTCHRPHSARSCEPDLRAVGASRWRAPLAWVWGVRVGCSPTPDCWSFGASGRAPLPTGCERGVRGWGPGCLWHLLPCRGSLCVMRASRVCGTGLPLWLDTCPRAVVVAGGLPLWRASWPRVAVPRLVRSGRSPCSGVLSCRCGAFPHPGGCRLRLHWVAARGTWRPDENQAHCACRWPPPRQERWARSASYLFGAP